jgi:hypothetical protein
LREGHQEKINAYEFMVPVAPFVYGRAHASAGYALAVNGFDFKFTRKHK